MFAPHTRTTTRSPPTGRYAPAIGRREARGASRLRDQVDVTPQAALRVADRVVGHQHHPIDPAHGGGERDLADAAGAERSAAIPPTSTSTGSPAASAACMRRAALGLHADHADRHPGTTTPTPAISPPPPTATRIVSASGTCSVELHADRPGAGHDLRLIERVHGQRAGLRLARGRGHGRLVVVPRDHVDVGPMLADPIDLGGGRRVGDEDLGAVTERARGVRDREPEVPARGGDRRRRPARRTRASC